MKSIKTNILQKRLTLISAGTLIAFNFLAIQTGTRVADASASDRVIVVSTTIQEAVDAAQPGDTVFVPPGTYRENVRVTKDEITIRGGLGAVLDGTGLAGNTGIRVASLITGARINRFRLSGLTIQNYSRNGVLLLRVDNFHISRGQYLNNDFYGIFPILSSNGVIDFNHVSGSDDTGIYIGQSHDVVIEKNNTRNCTIGVEIENSSRIAVRNNKALENSLGIVTQLRASLSVAATEDIEVSGNEVIRNNRPNPISDPGNPLSRLPSGVGILNVGGDSVRIIHNIVTHNNSGGIVVVRLPPEATSPVIDPLPDNNQIIGNVALQNGSEPDPRSPLPGRDLLWDFSGNQNCWADNVFGTSFPVLPACV